MPRTSSIGPSSDPPDGPAATLAVDDAPDLTRRFAAARAAFAHAGAPNAAQRRAHLASLERLLRGNTRALARAVAADFGRRAHAETRLTEIVPSLKSARFARRELARWMRSRRVPVAWYFAPSRARVVVQPLGVVGIVAAWNYPLVLACGPLIAALAAGNRALLKMSELTPRTGDLLARLIADTFAADHVGVVTGGVETGRAFAALPFDHLLFTGSARTGRSVMRAAAANLTPVTLELGGKSPAIVGRGASAATAAARIMSGKCRNAGQTCIAPDYALVPERDLDAFIEAARRSVARRYPGLATNPDYAAIVDAAHAERLASLLADARAKGATVISLDPQPSIGGGAGSRCVPPAIVTGVSGEMRIMREEIFGPLLPVLTYSGIDEAIAYVNARPRPLALYYFGTDRTEIDAVLARTTSGGVCLNDVMLHFAQEALPFGGVGESGMGAYHGRAGFETFSHRKAVFDRAPIGATALLEPPYGLRFEALLRILGR